MTMLFNFSKNFGFDKKYMYEVAFFLTGCTYVTRESVVSYTAYWVSYY